MHHLIQSKNFFNRCFALFAGTLLPLAFSPFYYAWLAILSPALLLGVWMKTSPREAFYRGWLYGFGFFGVGVSWVYVSIHVYGNTHALIAGFLTFGFVAFLALFPAIQGYLLQYFFADNRSSHSKTFHTAIKATLYFPASWVFIEWVRSWILTGFPWLQLAHSQVDAKLAGFVPILGVFGVGTLIVCLSGLFYLFYYQVKASYLTKFNIKILKDKTLWISPLSILLIFFIGSGLEPTHWHWTKKLPEPIHVALIQGNIPQQLKWSSAQVTATLRLYPKLSQTVWKESDLVVWPEGAITLPLPWSIGYLNRLLQIVRFYSTNLVVGIPEQSVQGFEYYNAMVLLGKTGIDVYHKRYLVPFGEYVPFEEYLRGIIGFFNLPMSNFTAGNKTGPQVLKNHGNLEIAPFSCYEIAYPQAILTTVPYANLMVVTTNDSWFGQSLAPWQHLQIAQFAALCAGRYLLFSTNDGITAVIDTKGKIVARAPRFKTAVLQSTVYLTIGNTPWVAWVHQYILLLLGLVTIAGRMWEKSMSNRLIENNNE